MYNMKLSNFLDVQHFPSRKKRFVKRNVLKYLLMSITNFCSLVIYNAILSNDIRECRFLSSDILVM